MAMVTEPMEAVMAPALAMAMEVDQVTQLATATPQVTEVVCLLLSPQSHETSAYASLGSGNGNGNKASADGNGSGNAAGNGNQAGTVSYQHWSTCESKSETDLIYRFQEVEMATLPETAMVTATSSRATVQTTVAQQRTSLTASA